MANDSETEFVAYRDQYLRNKINDFIRWSIYSCLKFGRYGTRDLYNLLSTTFINEGLLEYFPHWPAFSTILHRNIEGAWIIKKNIVSSVEEHYLDFPGHFERRESVDKRILIVNKLIQQKEIQRQKGKSVFNNLAEIKPSNNRNLLEIKPSKSLKFEFENEVVYKTKQPDYLLPDTIKPIGCNLTNKEFLDMIREKIFYERSSKK